MFSQYSCVEGLNAVHQEVIILEDTAFKEVMKTLCGPCGRDRWVRYDRGCRRRDYDTDSEEARPCEDICMVAFCKPRREGPE